MAADDGRRPPAGPRRYTDDQLHRHWDEWAKDELSPGDREPWTERRWAHRRFVLGEDAVTAFVQCRRIQRAEFDRPLPDSGPATTARPSPGA